MMNRSVVIVLVLFLTVAKGYSQQANCAASIVEAEELYKAGYYDKTITLLNTVMKECSLTKREREDAYVILTQAYIEKGNYNQANQIIIKLLNNDPNFKLKEGLYQEDFYAYYNSINIRPLFSAGLKVGLNFPHFSTKKVYSVYSAADYEAAGYKPTTGYQYSAFVEWQFFNKLSLVADGSFFKMGYNRSIVGSSKDSLSIDYSEAIKSFETSMYLKKYFRQDPLKTFVYVGGYMSFLQSAKASVSLDYKLKDKITPDIDDYNLSKNNIDVAEMRNAKRQGIVFGAGINYKLKNFLITANAGYKVDIGRHFTNTDSRLKNQELLFKYYYTDSDVNLSRMELTMALSYIFKYSIKSK